MNPLKDRRVFDVSLVAGHRDYIGKESDFPAAFTRRLTTAARQAKRCVPRLRGTPTGRLHVTLRAVYGNRAPNFPHRKAMRTRQHRYAQILDWLTSMKRRDVEWFGWSLTPDDILILCGRAVGSWLTTLRRKIDRTSDRPSRFPPSGFCHIVLARPPSPLAEKERRKLTKWLGENPLSAPVRMSLRNPILLATRNHFGTVYDLKTQRELPRF